MSRRELARRCGVSVGIINRMCNNTTSQVSLKTLGALGQALGVPAGNLIADGKPRGRTRT